MDDLLTYSKNMSNEFKQCLLEMDLRKLFNEEVKRRNKVSTILFNQESKIQSDIYLIFLEYLYLLIIDY